MVLYHTAADDIAKRAMTNNCIILDLDSTLVYTHDDMKQLEELGILTNPRLLPLRDRTYILSLDDVGERRGTGTKYDFWGTTRPYVKDFLVFCRSRFKIVAVWSAGQRPYVEAVVDYLFQDIGPPDIIFTRDHLEGDGKPIKKMIADDPVIGRHMKLENTYALDDFDATYADNPDNGILIPPYAPPSTISGLSSNEISLLQFKYWLLLPEVMASKDIRTLDKSRIFETPLHEYQDRLKDTPASKFL